VLDLQWITKQSNVTQKRHATYNYLVPPTYYYLDRSMCFHVDVQHPKKNMVIERLSIHSFGTRSKRATTN